MKQKWIEERIHFLTMVAEKAENMLMNAPEGILRLSGSKEKPQLYHRKNKKDKNGKYIRKNQMPLAEELAQKMYCERILKEAKRELHYLNKAEKYCEEDQIEKIYSDLQIPYKKLVVPVTEPREEYRKKWLSASYQTKGFSEDDPEYYSEKDERMRSKSEVLIANLLIKYDIPYHYEKPLVLKNYGTVYPDFTILDERNRQELYWEHLGMMDDLAYCEKSLAKITTYEKNGLYLGDRLLVTYETKKQSLNMRLLEKKIRDLLW